MGNLPPGCTVKDIEKFCRGYGKIASIILKSNKYGFVDFCSYRDADRAVRKLDGEKLNGYRIPVEHGKGIKSTSGKRATWTTKYGTPKRTKYRLRVENLSSSIGWQDLKDIFRARGEVTYAQAHQERLREAEVDLESKSDLERVFASFQGKRINGRQIIITDISEDQDKETERETERSRSRDRDERLQERGYVL